MNYRIALAKCGDTHDERVHNQEQELNKMVEDMQKAIHHVELNKKLEECFAKLDEITVSYRNYDGQY